MRINKYLSDMGVCSRREADRMVEQGRVLLNGRIAVLGDQIEEGDSVFVDGKLVLGRPQREIVVMLNKPRGIVCSTVSTHGEKNVVDYVAFPERIYPVGRLDKESEGLLLLTNQGALMDGLLRSRNAHEKEYVVTLSKPYSKDFLRKMEAGVPILDTVTRPCRCYGIDERRFGIILTQGLNRQIRRMCDYFHYEVEALERIRFANVVLGNLKRGEWRELSKEELSALESIVQKTDTGRTR